MRGHSWWNRVVRRSQSSVGFTVVKQPRGEHRHAHTRAMGTTARQRLSLRRSGRRRLDSADSQYLAAGIPSSQPLSDRAGQFAAQINAAAYPVSLHVRRGDFISTASAAQFHALTGLDYFHQAVTVVRRAHVKAQFFVFSDDPVWVTEHLLPTLPSGSVAVASLASEEDFVLMSRCHGNIICNSGFSWTAAWLNGS